MTENNEKSLKIPKGIIRIDKSTDNTVAKRKRKGQIMIYKTLYRKLKLAKHEPHLRSGVDTDVPEE
jgi:hypothetical protein